MNLELGFYFSEFNFLNVQRWTSEANAFSVSSSPYNPLDEPSPLGLSLKKSPSLLDLIQAKLSQETAKLATMNKKDQKDQKGANAAAFSTADKLKASNFPALILKIGSWEVLTSFSLRVFLGTKWNCFGFPFVFE